MSVAKDIIEILEHEGVSGLPAEWFQKDKSVQLPGGSSAAPTGPSAAESVETLVNSSVGEPPGSGKDLRTLEQEALSCTKCKLSETRNKVVFGTGKTDSPLIAFVGGRPGHDEDMKGEPFVGKAGQLLTSAITKGLKLKREDVYICNVLKCCPPNKRGALTEEINTCSPYVFEQLRLVKPKVIVALGKRAQHALCGDEKEGRGSWLEWEGVKVMPTFHPEYILKNQAAKKPFWEDLQMVMKELNLIK